MHYRVLADPTYLSFCDVSATFSCTQVYSSRFGIVAGHLGRGLRRDLVRLCDAAFRGRPDGPSERAESVPAYLFAGSTLSLAVVLYLGYASFVLLKLVCVLCLITYAAVIGLFIVSGAATSIPMLTLPRRAAGDVKALVSNPIALVLTLIFVAGAGSALALLPARGGVRRRDRRRSPQPPERLNRRPPSSSASWHRRVAPAAGRAR